jgi:hypothetical protein
MVDMSFHYDPTLEHRTTHAKWARGVAIKRTLSGSNARWRHEATKSTDCAQRGYRRASAIRFIYPRARLLQRHGAFDATDLQIALRYKVWIENIGA